MIRFICACVNASAQNRLPLGRYQYNIIDFYTELTILARALAEEAKERGNDIGQLVGSDRYY